MRFGVREICDVVFKPLTSVDIGNQHFDAMQPVLYLDTAKTSTLEGASTTVYAQGGKGNPRLIGWDGEKTLTFTVEDALMSPVSFAMLSGAGIVKGAATMAKIGGDGADKDNSAGYIDDMGEEQKIYVHRTFDLVVETYTSGEGNDKKTDYYARLAQDVRDGATLVATKEAPIYATILDSAGAQKFMLSAIQQDEIKSVAQTDGVPGQYKDAAVISAWSSRGVMQIASTDDIFFVLANTWGDPSQQGNEWDSTVNQGIPVAGDTVRIDCYAVYGKGAQELQIDAENFAGYYYIEASTLFRDEATGQDFPAEFIIPRGKIQSNFTFTMANSGDPSTFTFTIDAFPAYTKFNKTKKVMAALQIIDPEAAKHNYANKNVIGHVGREDDLDDYYKGLYPDEDAPDKRKSIFNQLNF